MQEVWHLTFWQIEIEIQLILKRICRRKDQKGCNHYDVTATIEGFRYLPTVMVHILVARFSRKPKKTASR